MPSLTDFADHAVRCREQGGGLCAFLRLDSVRRLGWPDDVIEQWLYDHADKASFGADYGRVDLSQITWEVEALPIDLLLKIQTGPSDDGAIEGYALAPDHWIDLRRQGVHRGVRLAWEVHGTWKRWPIIVDTGLLGSAEPGLQLVEGRTRVGVLRGRKQQGDFVAARHLAWVGRGPAD
ncbi:hypothetical protein [Microbacterium sp.]|uniref:hypothetical protein n=1 Tax=Microbacterium sp. TaxID=51671 RepID=UPI00333FA222